MSLLAWITLGLIAGFIVGKIVSRAGQVAVMDIVLGLVGAARVLAVYHAVSPGLRQAVGMNFNASDALSHSPMESQS